MPFNLDSFEVSRLDREDIRSIASHVRNLFLVPPNEYFPIVRILEIDMCAKYEDYHLEILDVEDMGDNHGLTTPSKQRIQIRLDVYEKASRGVGEDRFTMAHELGHLFLHPEEPAYPRQVAKHDIPREHQSEWQANVFAEELLMPVDAVLKAKSSVDLVRRLGVGRMDAYNRWLSVRKEAQQIIKRRTVFPVRPFR